MPKFVAYDGGKYFVYLHKIWRFDGCILRVFSHFALTSIIGSGARFLLLRSCFALGFLSASMLDAAARFLGVRSEFVCVLLVAVGLVVVAVIGK